MFFLRHQALGFAVDVMPMSTSKQENLKNVSFQCFFSLFLLPLMLIDNGTRNTFCYGLVTSSSLFHFYPRKSCFKWKTRGMMGFEVNQDGERQQYYVQLLQWLQYNVTQSWISSKVKISPSKISGSSFMSGYGVFSTGAISEGELLFVIPSDGCISFSSSIMNDDFG